MELALCLILPLALNQALLFSASVVYSGWRALSAAIAFLGIVSVCRPLPQDRGRARAAGNRFARDDKAPGPQLVAKQLPGERPREPAETRHTGPQPSQHVRKKGADPLSGAEEQTARTFRAYALCACSIFFQIGSVN